MKVITFYSDPPGSNYYSKHAETWVSNVESYGLDYHIEKLDSNDYWVNTRRKPQYILDCLEKFKETVLWVDVDTIFKTYKPYISHPFIALKQNTSQLYSSCLHFEYCEETINFLQTWRDLCIENANDVSPQGDHHYLYKAIAKTKMPTHYFTEDFWDIKTQSLSPFGGSKH